MSDWVKWIDVVIRSIMSLIVLFFLTKMLGKKQVAQLSVFDYVIGISMGSIASEMTVNVKSPYIDGLTAMVIYASIALAMSHFTLKSIKLRRFVTGVPVVIVQKGKILQKGLQKAMLDVNDFLVEARIRGYFDISELEYAIMETSGKISFLLKSEHSPVTPEYLKLKVPYKGLVADLVIDGKVMINNIKKLGKNEKWLRAELKKQGYETLDNILLVTYDNNNKVRIYERNLKEIGFSSFE